MSRKNVLTRRQFVRLLSLSIATTDVPGLFDHPHFIEAKKNKLVRKDYVKYIKNKLGKIEYIDDIIYLGDSSDKKTGVSIQNYIFGDVGKRKKYIIGVYDGVFDHPAVISENDFLSVLVDHEIEGHARNFHYGFEDFYEEDFLKLDEKGYNGDVGNAVFELVAFGNQLKNKDKRGISDQLLYDTLLKYYINYSDLIHPIRDNAIKNKEMLKKFRKMFFIKDFYDLTVNIDGKESKVILPDGRMMTIHGPVKLPEYIFK